MRNSALIRAIIRRHRFLLFCIFIFLLFSSFSFIFPSPEEKKKGKIIPFLVLYSLSVSQSTLRSISPRFSSYPTCQSHLLLSSRRLKSTKTSLLTDRNWLSARAYLSAALHYQYDCFNYLSNLNKSTSGNLDPSLFSSITHLSNLTGKSLFLLNNFIRFRFNVSQFNPELTERQGFFESPAVITPKKIESFSFLPKTTQPNTTVCKIGSCDYKSIQSAISSAPNNSSTQYIIHIKSGIYKEIIQVPFEKTNIIIIGDGMGKTVISGKLNAQIPNLTTIDTATFTALGDGFRAFNLTFENLSGIGAHQAVAFRSDSDQSILNFVEFKGHQDTLYARSMRQLYVNCKITGTIDFIFGNAAAIFHNCIIETVPRLENHKKMAKNVITAHGRTNPNQATGFVFNNCKIKGSNDYLNLYLGRPWKEYSRVIFIGCNLGKIVNKEGWLKWRGDFALSSLYYGEYDNWGPGAETKWRVNWSSKVPKERLNVYSVENFIQGHEWI